MSLRIALAREALVRHVRSKSARVRRRDTSRPVTPSKSTTLLENASWTYPRTSRRYMNSASPPRVPSAPPAKQACMAMNENSVFWTSSSSCPKSSDQLLLDSEACSRSTSPSKQVVPCTCDVSLAEHDVTSVSCSSIARGSCRGMQETPLPNEQSSNSGQESLHQFSIGSGLCSRYPAHSNRSPCRKSVGSSNRSISGLRASVLDGVGSLRSRINQGGRASTKSGSDVRDKQRPSNSPFFKKVAPDEETQLMLELASAVWDTERIKFGTNSSDRCSRKLCTFSNGRLDNGGVTRQHVVAASENAAGSVSPISSKRCIDPTLERFSYAASHEDGRRLALQEQLMLAAVALANGEEASLSPLVAAKAEEAKVAIEAVIHAVIKAQQPDASDQIQQEQSAQSDLAGAHEIFQCDSELRPQPPYLGDRPATTEAVTPNSLSHIKAPTGTTGVGRANDDSHTIVDIDCDCGNMESVSERQLELLLKQEDTTSEVTSPILQTMSENSPEQAITLLSPTVSEPLQPSEEPESPVECPSVVESMVSVASGLSKSPGATPQAHSRRLVQDVTPSQSIPPEPQGRSPPIPQVSESILWKRPGAIAISQFPTDTQASHSKPSVARISALPPKLSEVEPSSRAKPHWSTPIPPLPLPPPSSTQPQQLLHAQPRRFTSCSSDKSCLASASCIAPTNQPVQQQQLVPPEASQSNDSYLHPEHQQHVFDQLLRLKHVFFNFDQTISRVHVFHHLSEVALTESGQVQLCMELDASRSFRYNADVGKVEDDPFGSVSWSCAALGGPAHVEMLRIFFEELSQAGIRQTIITSGYVGVVKYILSQQSLECFFEMIYGNIGSFFGERDYDVAHASPTPYDGDVVNTLTATKPAFIASLLQKAHMQWVHAALIDDDSQEILSVEGICRSVFVCQRRGMTSRELNTIREMCGLRALPDIPAA